MPGAPDAPVDDPDHLWVDWPTYHGLIEQLAILVHDSRWRVDHVLCLARGGMRVGDVLSRVFDKPLAILSTSSYRADGGTKQGALDIGSNITMTSDTLAGQVLLVDDLVDSGVTLTAVSEHLRASYPAVQALRTAVLWHKARSSFQPDYAVSVLNTNPWIHQPFEEYDGMDMAALIERQAG